jgi:ATP phosphoribosyltransferase
MITIALTKGRILEETLPLLEAIGVVPNENPITSRKLIFEAQNGDIRFVILRGSDVPTYVKRGAADLGITGKDILMEVGAEDIYEWIDLGIARCRLMTATRKGDTNSQPRVRVATKYVNIAREYYARKGKQVEIFKLYGGMEVAPLLDLADEIVDIVDTGKTLEANGLEAREKIADISSRLIINRASMKLKFEQIQPLLENIARQVEQ